MKAAVCFEPNSRLDVVEVEQEGPRAGEARVKVKAAGVCHSDWHIMNGDWPVPLPMVLGHEAAGVVTKLGEPHECWSPQPSENMAETRRNPLDMRVRSRFVTQSY